LQGVVLAADDAANLGCEPGAPALRIVRRYFSDDGQLVEVADNVHPSDRFSYRMELRK
jgi:GntR family transcriptional regulator